MTQKVYEVVGDSVIVSFKGILKDAYNNYKGDRSSCSLHDFVQTNLRFGSFKKENLDSIIKMVDLWSNNLHKKQKWLGKKILVFKFGSKVDQNSESNDLQKAYGMIYKSLKNILPRIMNVNPIDLQIIEATSVSEFREKAHKLIDDNQIELKEYLKNEFVKSHFLS